MILRVVARDDAPGWRVERMDVAGPGVVISVVGRFRGRLLIVMEDDFLAALHRDARRSFFDLHQRLLREDMGEGDDGAQDSEERFHISI